MRICPKCGHTLAYTSTKGGWCYWCREWLPDDIIQEYIEEAGGLNQTPDQKVKKK